MKPVSFKIYVNVAPSILNEHDSFGVDIHFVNDSKSFYY